MTDLKNNALELEEILNSKLDLISNNEIILDHIGTTYVEFVKRAIAVLKTADLEENSIQDLKLLSEIRKLAHEFLDRLEASLSYGDK